MINKITSVSVLSGLGSCDASCRTTASTTSRPPTAPNTPLPPPSSGSELHSEYMPPQSLFCYERIKTLPYNNFIILQPSITIRLINIILVVILTYCFVVIAIFIVHLRIFRLLKHNIFNNNCLLFLQYNRNIFRVTSHTIQIKLPYKLIITF